MGGGVKGAGGEWALRRYQEVRSRLPEAVFPVSSEAIDDVGDLLDQIDVFVLDGFGVLNVGQGAVPGAIERMKSLRDAGKQLIVLTNGATLPKTGAVAKYQRLGFEFAPDEVVSSRDALARGLTDYDAGLRWGAAATPASELGQLASHAVLLDDDERAYDQVDGFFLLSALDWNASRQQLLERALRRRWRPVLVGNPDLVAPYEWGLSFEPGYYGHWIADAFAEASDDQLPRFYGKPFANAFELVAERIRPAVAPERIAMVGDSLHTDILGGAVMGWRTVLVTDHGLLKNLSIEHWLMKTGIRPDFIARTT